MGMRRKGRELALQALYQQEITGEVSENSLRGFWLSSDATEPVKAFALSLVEGVVGRRAEIDALVDKAAANWRLDRLSKVDLNVLRLATYELLGTPEVPPSVVINEAIEIVRRFGSEESAVFVNGVLDQVATQLGVKPVGKTAEVVEVEEE
ncbi:MAG: transcription antitermination factor NusB [Deltaproteobacteria bacterium]|nr:transcription antitermination factor NusB [Deltaproteobacteria bacterium]MBI3389155.1 transcription antitermination factor NusB [Deltaproteobacteria bacterium]